MKFSMQWNPTGQSLFWPYGKLIVCWPTADSPWISSNKQALIPDVPQSLIPAAMSTAFNRVRPSRLSANEFWDRATTTVLLLTVGLASRKGHDMVIGALPTLLRTVPDVTYVMVGAGPQGYLDELARELRVRDRVIFTGPVSDELLSAIYGLCDIFVMPSRQDLAQHSVEGFGLVFLEANACGKPVIAGRSGGTDDAVVHGVTGFLVDPDDPDDIATLLETFLRTQRWPDGSENKAERAF